MSEQRFPENSIPCIYFDSYAQLNANSSIVKLYLKRDDYAEEDGAQDLRSCVVAQIVAGKWEFVSLIAGALYALRGMVADGKFAREEVRLLQEIIEGYDFNRPNSEIESDGDE